MERKVYNVGIFPGKFLPPHKGHLNAILKGASQCKKFYVIVSDNNDFMEKMCKEANINPMSLELRAKWMSKELRNIENIEVLILDETGIPSYPEGTIAWSKLLIERMPEKFDAIFGGELEYKKTYMSNFPGVEYKVHDHNRTQYSISATEIRKDYLKYWDYILESARSHFVKRLL